MKNEDKNSRVLNALKAGGLTCEEIAKKTKLPSRDVSDTLRTLAQKKKVEDSGKRRKEGDGKAVIWIYVVAEEDAPVKEGDLSVSGMSKEGLSRALDLCKALALFKTKDAVSLGLTSVKGGLIFSAESGGCTIRSLVEGKTEGAGSVTLDLENLIRLNLVGKTASIRLVKGKVEVHSGHATYKLTKIKGETKLPTIPKQTDATTNVQAGVLSAALKSVWFSHDDSGTGDVRVLWGKGKLRVETADEFRGVTFSKPMPIWKDLPLQKVVLPKKTLDAITKCFSSEDIVNLDITSSKMRLYTEDDFISVPLLTTSDLPSVGSTLRAKLDELKKSTVTCSLASGELKELTRAALTVLRDEKKYVSAHFIFEVKDKHLHLQTEGDIGSFVSKIPVKIEEGSTARACVLCRSVKDMSSLVAATSGDEIVVEIWKKDLVVLRNTDRDFSTTYAIVQVRE